MENTWSLQAMLRPKEQQYDHQHDHQDDGFGSIDIKKEYDQALLFCYPHLFDNNHHHDHATSSSTLANEVIGDELDQLYKPYNYPLYGTESEFSPPPADLQTIHLHQDSDQEQVQGQDIKNFCGSSSKISQVAPKLKKRKNQQKRVVVQVTAEGLSSDPWAWRKYGQKPIKGSIYPRSYYRCSTSKGCLARRQVEQSCNDSSIYILTYTADHNHSQPTRRNSLAGINRNRFKANSVDSSCASSKTIPKDSIHSPTTTHSANSSIDDELVLLQQSNIKQETNTTTFYNKFDYQGRHDHMMLMDEGINNDDCMFFSDDFFEGLEDLGGYKMESSSSSSYNNFSNKQFPCLFS